MADYNDDQPRPHHHHNAPAAAGGGQGGGGFGLVRPGTLRLEDTNVALIGSDADKQERFAASGKEPAWSHTGKEPGLLVWRIEQFKVVAWPTKQYGMFFAGDSYIVLSTYKTGESDVLKYDLHFWLGKDTSQDEAGTAAYKTVELDDHLHCTPVEHRQVQGSEDELFLSYWHPMHVQEGGTQSGFKHFKAPDWPKKLYVVVGTNARNTRLTETQLHVNSLNSGDVFVLDLGTAVHQFNGSQASAFAKEKAAEFANKLVEDRDGEPQYIVGDEGDDNANNFLALIGGSSGQSINPPNPQQSTVPPRDPGFKKLFSFKDLELVAEGDAVNRSELKSSHAYVIDFGNEVYVWVGKKADNIGHHKHAMQKGIDYIRKYNRPFNLPLHRIVEGNENEAFNRAF